MRLYIVSPEDHDYGLLEPSGVFTNATLAREFLQKKHWGSGDITILELNDGRPGSEDKTQSEKA